MFKYLVELRGVASSKPEPQGATCFRPLEARATPKKNREPETEPPKKCGSCPGSCYFFLGNIVSFYGLKNIYLSCFIMLAIFH